MSQGAGATPTGPGQVKLKPLRRPGRCAGCHGELEVGGWAAWDRSSRAVWCLS